MNLFLSNKEGKYEGIQKNTSGVHPPSMSSKGGGLAGLPRLAIVGMIVATIAVFTVYGVTLSSSGSNPVITTAPITTNPTVVASPVSVPPSPVVVRIVPGAHLLNQTDNFLPSTITVVLGKNNTVFWVNNDFTPHTVTSDSGAFNSGILTPASSWNFTFTTPGNYTYHCSIHLWMKGAILVVPSSGVAVSSSNSTTSQTTKSSVTSFSRSTSCYYNTCYTVSHIVQSPTVSFVSTKTTTTSSCYYYCAGANSTFSTRTDSAKGAG